MSQAKTPYTGIADDLLCFLSYDIIYVFIKSNFVCAKFLNEIALIILKKKIAANRNNITRLQYI